MRKVGILTVAPKASDPIVAPCKEDGLLKITIPMTERKKAKQATVT